jgi:tetratricopeptide (TPR) repeat protein
MARWRPNLLHLPRIKAARLAAAKARRKPPEKKRTGWQTAALYWNGFREVALNCLGVLAGGFVLYVLWQSVTEKVIAIAPISVPQQLAVNGYTTDVATERLQGAFRDIVASASGSGWPDVALEADLPSIVVPSTALSTELLAAYIRSLFHMTSRRNISGEITLAQKTLWLHLWMDGQSVYVSASGGDPERPDDLFAAGAQKIFEEINPAVLASSLSKSDPAKSLEIRDRLFRNPGKRETSIAMFRKALEIEPRWVYGHDSLGLALSAQGKTEEAIAEFNEAIKLKPDEASSYNDLGLALSDQGKIEEAITKYKKAIELDPRNSRAHKNLSDALRKQGNNEAADAELKKAQDLEQGH